MKKIIFYVAVTLSIILLVNIISIITSDFDRLTQYGFGYLTGKIILLILFILISYVTRKNNLNNKAK